MFLEEMTRFVHIGISLFFTDDKPISTQLTRRLNLSGILNGHLPAAGEGAQLAHCISGSWLLKPARWYVALQGLLRFSRKNGGWLVGPSARKSLLFLFEDPVNDRPHERARQLGLESKLPVDFIKG